ncbi:twin-arginine translocase subunit TatB [uncultured Sphingomonas sp.]|uniref:twin-arginine translocase subunit TatB n=1 Tax=uncultured Sphingomonas sp. TaxID=158754 RepID=UPI0035C9D65B
MELLVMGAVALVVIPPKDLPKAMRFAGQWIGRARGLARQFRSGFDDMVREAELAEMEKKWAAENERIMREHPADEIALDVEATAAIRLPAPDEGRVEGDADDDRAPVTVAPPVFVADGEREILPVQTASADSAKP